MHDDGPHALAWAWWALAAVACLQLAPNPTYVLVVTALAVAAVEIHRREGALARAFPVLVVVAVLFVGVRVVLTAVTTSGGADALVTLPSVRLPTILGGFVIGGAVQGAVVLRAAAEGAVIVGMVAVFGAFNAIVRHDDLVRLAPRAFHEVGVIVTVALAFLPSTLAAVTAVRDADRARTGGAAVRRGRTRRLLVPVLERGMERAVRLAESMDARGFARGPSGQREAAGGWAALVGLLCLAAAFAGLVGAQPTVAWALAAGGLVAIVLAVVLASQASDRTRYRPRRPARPDVVTIAVVTLAPVGLGWLLATGHASMWRVGEGWPPVDPAVVVLLLLLAAPVVRRPRRQVAA